MQPQNFINKEAMPTVMNGTEWDGFSYINIIGLRQH